jgi:hypothetical protein
LFAHGPISDVASSSNKQSLVLGYGKYFGMESTKNCEIWQHLLLPNNYKGKNFEVLPKACLQFELERLKFCLMVADLLKLDEPNN